MSSPGHPRSLFSGDATAQVRRTPWQVHERGEQCLRFFQAPSQWVQFHRRIPQGCLISPSQHLVRMDFAPHGVQQPAESRRSLQTRSATCNSLRNLEGRCSRVTVPEKSCCAAVQQPVGVQPSAECRRLLQQREQLLRSGCSGATVCGMPKAVAADCRRNRKTRVQRAAACGIPKAVAAAPQATDAAVTLCAAVCGMPNVVAERTVDRVLAGTRCSRLRDADAEGCCSALTGITHSRVWGCRWWLQPDGRSRSRRGNVQPPVKY